MSILEKAKHEEFERIQMMQRIYQKIKPQERELAELCVNEIKFNGPGKTKIGSSIEIGLKNRYWLSPMTYYIYIVPAENGKVRLSLNLYHPFKTYIDDIVNEDQIEEKIANACSYYKRSLFS